MTTKIVGHKRSALFISWLGGLAAVMTMACLACYAYHAGDLSKVLDRQYLHLALFLAVAYSVAWIFTGWIHVAEGAFRLAEYGGCGNCLQRIHFGDGQKWQLTAPLNIPLEFKPPLHCIVILLVEENFLGWTRFRFRYFSLRYGRDIPPWATDDKDDPCSY